MCSSSALRGAVVERHGQQFFVHLGGFGAISTRSARTLLAHVDFHDTVGLLLLASLPHPGDLFHRACEGAGSLFDIAMLQSAMLAACEKLFDQSMPLMFLEIVSGQLLASRS